jgi:ferrochelatase
VRRYLREFLNDPRVVDISALGRWLLVNLFILPFRPAKSSEAYRKVWMPEGSPLLVHSRALLDRMRARMGETWQVELGMRYGNPSIASALTKLEAGGVDGIVAAPLFPHYAASSTGSALEELYRVLGAQWNVPAVATLPPFYDDPGFIEAFAAVGRPHIEELKADHVLFSFHGLPERQIVRSDISGRHCLRNEKCCDAMVAANANCYRAQCFDTARRIAARLSLAAGSWSVSFQSRLGRTPWIRPYTDHVLPELAARGVKRVAVFCPAFVADCLETLEEIGIRGRDQFRASGGEELRLVPSLNATDPWVEALAHIVEQAGRPSRRRALLPAARVSA